jgi:hypothetical protein
VSDFSRSGGPVPRPLGDELQKEHQAEIREQQERVHEAERASKRRPWWKFWARRSS